VLSVLAAAGTRPILPFKLLCAASGRLDGPDRPTGIHDILTDLRGYVGKCVPLLQGTAPDLGAAGTGLLARLHAALRAPAVAS